MMLLEEMIKKKKGNLHLPGKLLKIRFERSEGLNCDSGDERGKAGKEEAKYRSNLELVQNKEKGGSAFGHDYTETSTGVILREG